MATRPAKARTSQTERTASGTVDAVDRVLSGSRALVGVVARSLGDMDSDITLGQYRALVLLCQQGQLNMSALADALAVKPSTATGLCDRMVQKGLITRTTSSESRREVTLQPTAIGRDIIKSVTARRRRELARIIGNLDAKQQRDVARAFEAFADAAGELPDEAWKLGWT
jgi:DNA-binding MarR family transcriptional regulator